MLWWFETPCQTNGSFFKISGSLTASLKQAPTAPLSFPQFHQSPAEAQVPAPIAASCKKLRSLPHVSKLHGSTASSTVPAMFRKATTKKMTASKKTTAPKKLKKTKAVQIEIPFEDLFLNALVAFVLDVDISSWSKGVDFRPHSQMIGTKYYLFGSVIKNGKKKTSTKHSGMEYYLNLLITASHQCADPCHPTC